MQTFLTILIWILFGFLASAFAQKRGRDPLAWFFIGMLLGLFALIILFFLPSKVGQPIKPLSANSSEQPEMQPTNEETSPKIESPQEWYYLDKNRRQQGPVYLEQLTSLWQRNEIDDMSHVWSEGMDNWERIQKLPTLKAALVKGN